jgi:iron uptake system component EfeO
VAGIGAAGLAALGTGLALGLGGGSGPARPAAAGPGQVRVSVGVSGCGAGWTGPVAGRQDFLLANTDVRDADVQLIDPATGAVYAEVEPLGSGATAHLRITLGGGRYAFRCVMEDDAAFTGPTMTIDSSARTPVAPVLPVTQNDLLPATRAYERYVTGALPGLVADTQRARDDLARGDLSAARRDWLTAHLDYERLGAAYGAFGDADGAINGLPSGLPGGVTDPGFTGFHRLEYGLWGGQDAATLVPVADALLGAERDLITSFPDEQIDPLDISIRAHEITENALEFELTGRTDLGSHSALATVAANLDGTRVVLGLLRPLLVPRYPALGRLDASLAATARDVAAQRRPDGSYPPLDTLARASRERIDADVSELSELLAPVASICEPRRTS